MAEVRAFRGSRFSSAAGTLDSLVAPPYDVLSDAQRQELADRNHHNIVHLTLPEGKPEDRSKFVKYARSSALLHAWRRTGMIEVDGVESFYRYCQRFHLPHIGVLNRTCLVGLIKIEPFSTGTVLPHEHTFPKHKEDRLRLLEATHTHLELIFGLFEDPNAQLHEMIELAPSSETISAEGGGIEHRLDRIVDAEWVQNLSAGLVAKRIWIADGHHRYETALEFRNAMAPFDEAMPRSEVAEDFMPIALASMSDPGLVLLPTHRIVPRLGNKTLAGIAEELSPVYEAVTLGTTNPLTAVEAARAEGKHALGLVAPGGETALLIERTPGAANGVGGNEGSELLQRLDASLLHRIALEVLLKVPASDTIEYTRDEVEAQQKATDGVGAAFIMAPPTVEDMREIALLGERMPHKSTFYYPKIWSGFVLWSLEDH